MFEDCIQAIKESRVYDVAVSTPLERAPLMSARLDNEVFLKREDMQPVFSFKVRGAYNKIIQLSDDLKQRGVIAASAGNHAQGVALAAKVCGIKATIIMPITTPTIKINAVQQWGVDVVLEGDTYDHAYQHALKIAQQTSMVLIHPFDDLDIIAGQGTVGMEITAQFDGHIDAIFVPVGGGGLIAGVAAWVKHHSPQTKIISVEPADAPTLHTALKHGKPVTLDKVGLFADGVAVRRIGDKPFAIAKHTVDATVLVTTDEMCAAIKDNFDDTRTLLEPAGALGIAGLKKYAKEKQLHGKNLLAINTGANINFDRLKHIVERYEFGEDDEMIIAVTIPEQVGSFLNFCRAIGKRTITEFNYRYSDQTDAHVFVGLKVGTHEKNALLSELQTAGYSVEDLSSNEMAKLHLRHMIGGHISNVVKDELLCRFQFPERPGALLEFLEHLGDCRWNISLFHYRNHGSAYGRVLAGVQVPSADRERFVTLMGDTEYRYRDESDNPAYRLFLR